MSRKLIYLYFTLLCVFSDIALKAQHSNIISVSLSNNGQIQEQLSNFYLPFPKTTHHNQKFLVNHTQQQKINFSYERAITTNNYLGLMIGIGKWNGYSAQNGGEKVEEYQQTFSQYSLTYNYNFQLDNKFSLISGFAFTLFNINDFKAHTNPRYQFGELNYLDKVVSSGGKIYGTNFNTKIRYNISTAFFVTTSLSIGLLYYDLGKTTTSTTTDFINNETVINVFTFNKILHKTTFSNPELFIGFGITF